MVDYNQLKKDLAHLLNKYSMEQESDTPDFILAEYLAYCLIGWGRATRARDRWYENKPENDGK